jgi:hypothetical protein
MCNSLCINYNYFFLLLKRSRNFAPESSAGKLQGLMQKPALGARRAAVHGLESAGRAPSAVSARLIITEATRARLRPWAATVRPAALALSAATCCPRPDMVSSGRRGPGRRWGSLGAPCRAPRRARRAGVSGVSGQLGPEEGRWRAGQLGGSQACWASAPGRGSPGGGGRGPGMLGVRAPPCLLAAPSCMHFGVQRPAGLSPHCTPALSPASGPALRQFGGLCVHSPLPPSL